jgi:hypothetical protein
LTVRIRSGSKNLHNAPQSLDAPGLLIKILLSMLSAAAEKAPNTLCSFAKNSPEGHIIALRGILIARLYAG